MKKIFILALFTSLFVSVNSVWAQSADQKSEAPAKVEKAVKKADTSKATACCAKNKEGCPAKVKEGCPAKTKEGCPAKAKEGCPAKTKERCAEKVCCAEKKTGSKAATSCCTNKAAANETKSSGKKEN